MMTGLVARVERWLPYVLAGMVLLAVVVNVASLLSYPRPHCDEAGDASIAYTRVTEGRARISFLSGELGEREINPGIGQLYYPVLGWMLVAADRAFWAVRLHAWLGWLLAVGLVFLAGWKHRGWLTGLLAALVVATDMEVMVASHFGRPESWVLAATAAVMALYVYAEQKPAPLHYALVGFVVVQVPVQVYFSGVFFTAGFFALVFLEAVMTRKDWWKPAYIAAGAGAGLLFWGLAFFLPNAEALTGVLGSATAAHCDAAFCMPEMGTTIEALVIERLRSFVAYVADVLTNNLAASAVQVAALYSVAGIGVVLLRGKLVERKLAGWWLLALLAFVALAYRNRFYFALWSPIGALLIASAVVHLAETIRERAPALAPTVTSRLIAVLLLVPLIEINLATQVRIAASSAQHDFSAYSGEVRALITPDTKVLGDATLWFVLHGRNHLVADVVLDAESYHVEGEEAVAQLGVSGVVRSVAPSYAVDDGTLGCWWWTSARALTYRDYLQRHCTEIGAVSGYPYAMSVLFEPGTNGKGADRYRLQTTVYRCAGDDGPAETGQ